jgi:hypothetical protein
VKDKQQGHRGQWKRAIAFAARDNILYQRYRNNPGFDELVAFISNRYFAIETRLHETFRFVDLHPNNASTFSYEYASLLRDVGSAFDSALKVFGRQVEGTQNPRIHDHLVFLRQNLPLKKPSVSPELTHLSVELASDRADRFLLPFTGVRMDSNKANLPSWWEAYNDVKHLEIEKLGEGNLKNVLNASAALFALFVLTDKNEGRGYPYKVFADAKFDQTPMESDRQLLWFFKD